MRRSISYWAAVGTSSYLSVLQKNKESVGKEPQAPYCQAICMVYPVIPVTETSPKPRGLRQLLPYGPGGPNQLLCQALPAAFARGLKEVATSSQPR